MRGKSRQHSGSAAASMCTACCLWLGCCTCTLVAAAWSAHHLSSLLLSSSGWLMLGVGSLLASKHSRCCGLQWGARVCANRSQPIWSMRGLLHSALSHQVTWGGGWLVLVGSNVRKMGEAQVQGRGTAWPAPNGWAGHQKTGDARW